MAETNQKRQSWQLTHRRLLIFATMAGVMLAFLTRRMLDYRQSTRAAAEITRLGGVVSGERGILNSLIEVQTVGRIIEVYFSNPTLNADDWQKLSQIPHSFGVAIEGNTFSLGELHALAPAKHLDYVLLHAAIGHLVTQWLAPASQD